MILKSRLYERKSPDRDATLFVIYCEGSRREPQYFKYFKGISSRINLEVVEADSQGNNSPLGLYEKGKALPFSSTRKDISYGTTEVFKLGKEMYPMIESVIEEAKRQQGILNETHRS